MCGQVVRHGQRGKWKSAASWPVCIAIPIAVLRAVWVGIRVGAALPSAIHSLVLHLLLLLPLLLIQMQLLLIRVGGKRRR